MARTGDRRGHADCWAGRYAGQPRCPGTAVDGFGTAAESRVAIAIECSLGPVTAYVIKKPAEFSGLFGCEALSTASCHAAGLRRPWPGPAAGSLRPGCNRISGTARGQPGRLG